jgi:uncharacterized membrane protein YedE/YeeE
MNQRVKAWVRRRRLLSFTAALVLVAGVGAAAWAASVPGAPADQVGRWSPYAVGFGIGLLSCVSFVVSNRPIGVSTAYAQTSGMIGRAVAGQRVDRMPYYRTVKPEIGWEWMLALGVLLGAWLSANLSGNFHIEPVPPIWVSEFGPNAAWRWWAAFAGGGLLGVGSRWAGGCTSGHGISGTLQLVASSWLAVVCFFAGGIATAFVLY